MGQYGNQPDFGTEAKIVNITGNAADGPGAGNFFKPAALYIGTGGTLVITVVGGNDGPYNTTVFENVPDGTFFPVVATCVWALNGSDVTTCSNIVALY